jgi:hypothetical protein
LAFSADDRLDVISPIISGSGKGSFAVAIGS